MRCLFVVLLLLGCSRLVQAEEPALPRTHLKVVGSWDFLSQFRNYEEPFWSKSVPEKSAGQVTAEITAFNKLGLKGTEIIRLMKLGAVDFGTMVLAYGTDSDVEGEGADLAGLSPDVTTARAVVKVYTPVLDQFFQKTHGIKVLGVWPYPAQILFCKSRLSSIADLKGRKVRVGTRPVGELVEALGGVSVNIPFGEAYAAIRDGAIDCAVTGALPGNAAKLPEITQYLYVLPMGWSMAMQGVNQQTWDRLDPAVQRYLMAGLDEMNSAIWSVAASETEEGINCNTGHDPCTRGIRGKMTLIPVSDSDRKLLRKVLSEVVIRRWAQRCSNECVDNWNRTVGKLVGLTARR